MIENEKYSIFQMETNSEIMFFKDTTSTDINDTMKRYADCNGYYPEFVKNCERISEVEFAELEQSTKNSPAFCAEINLDDNPMTLVVWNNDKIAAVYLDEAIQSINENGEIHFNYLPFAEDYGFDETIGEYDSNLSENKEEFVKISDKKRLFVDMDGTLAEFKTVDTLEKLYEPHYFEKLKPNESVVNAINEINRNCPEIEVYILSAVLTDSKYALNEKKNWIKEYLPDIPEERCIFPPCGEDKKDFIPNGIKSDDFLLDDYSINLNSWEPPARGIKLLNGINGNNGTWDKDSISFLNSSDVLAEKIRSIINDNIHISEQRPQELSDFELEIQKVDEWADKVITKAGERENQLEEENRNNYNR